MNLSFKKILVIQTAFIGDTILATSVAEELHEFFPQSEIFLLVRKGNHALFENHPFLQILTHDKTHKFSSLFNLFKNIRKEKFDVVVNLHRYTSSHLLTILSGARVKLGYSSIFKMFYTHTIQHNFQKGLHEIHRYHSIIQPLTHSEKIFLPKIYPPQNLPDNFFSEKEYICLFPGSLWPTKQLPPTKWIELIHKIPDKFNIFLCGSKEDNNLCEYIKVKSQHPNVTNIAGMFSLLETASIVQKAKRVFVNDSAPLHIASALNIPVTAFFCSTVTNFGFFPLSDDAQVIEVENLDCRPCGIHGHKQCPRGHFRCGLEISLDEIKI
ncbi:MAG: ADP-heptose--LPS heptosyltransferase II [Bacteroidia bacterium]|nr:MAG: ADP-heptose--LPS heptosyltransferase II [Bacteroidia bacterium]